MATDYKGEPRMIVKDWEAHEASGGFYGNSQVAFVQHSNAISTAWESGMRWFFTTAVYVLLSSSSCSAQFAEWYLDCSVLNSDVAEEISSAFPYRDLKSVQIYMSFNNGGTLNAEDAKVEYKSDRGTYSPISMFDRVRFDRGKGLVTGKVTWIGTEPRLLPTGWSISGEVQVSDDGANISYKETVRYGRKVRGSMTSSCVFNNPN